jgi:hypothetical protein
MRYLIPIDGSPASLERIAHAERAVLRGERVEVVLLSTQPRFSRHIAQFTRKADRDAWRAERAKAAAAGAVDRLARAGIPFRLVVKTDNPAQHRYLLPAGIVGIAALILAAE